MSSTNPLEASYDFSSIMHYGKRSFSATGKDSIEVIGNPDQQIGQRGAFSKSDIEELNALYDCSNPGKGGSNFKFTLFMYQYSHYPLSMQRETNSLLGYKLGLDDKSVSRSMNFE